ncbi:DUF6538 domain-containing protein [Aestuariivirga sp.]|uniref:DUF6538 domain-containing protein n=1 Tax=Aestuariivirga sp. TaxID=2650926 RepID=UPI00359312CA
MRANHHLRLRGSVWFFQIKIPADLRQHYKSRAVVAETLGTSDLIEARIKRTIKLTAYEKDFSRLRKDGVDLARDMTREIAELELEEYELLRRDPWRAAVEPDPKEYGLSRAKHDDDFRIFAATKAHNRFTANQPAPPPVRRTEPVDNYLNGFLAAKEFSVQHASKSKSAVLRLKAWMEVQGMAATVGNVTRELAGDYMQTVPGTRKTRVNIAGLLSSYFRYIVSPLHKLDKNPFEGLAGDLEGNAKVIVKRDYRDDEIQKLLSGGKAEMVETIRVLLLSGLRASELCAMTVADSAHDEEADRRVFRVHGGPDDVTRKAKTLSSKRVVPVHTDIDGIVSARCEGKAAGGLLFPEWHGKANALGQRFAEHRLARHVDDTRPGEKQSRIDLHSTRRSFAARAMAAYASGVGSFTPWTVADVLGHDREVQVLPMTKKYAGLSPMKERIACVEAVRLPS